VSPLAAQLLATNWGSPGGVSTDAHQVLRLWKITYYLAVPIGIIVIGGVLWCVFRYRHKPGDLRQPKQFQYHIPIEAAYTIIPLIIVVALFGFVYNAENKEDNLTKHPAVKITVEGFQWGWRFTYPNGHQEVGSVATQPSINDSSQLPVLYMPENEPVQFTLESDDVVHSFYVPEFLFQRDLIQGINNVVDITATQPGTFIGECTNLCGTYHAFMRFEVDVMPPKAFGQWMAQQPANSIHCVGGSC
jgi:cytochrome c oxidase subunit II